MALATKLISAGSLTIFVAAAVISTAGADDEVARFRQGAAILDAAVAAAGGRTALDSLSRVRFELDGDASNAVQGFDAADVDHPKTDGRLRVLNAFDENANLYTQETEQRLAGGFNIRSGSVIAGGALFSIQFAPRRYSRSEGPAASPDTLTQIAARYFPPLVLRRAVINRSSVRLVGTEGRGQGTVDVISVSWVAGVRYELGIGRATRHIEELVALAPDPLTGDAATTIRYSGYHTAGGLTMPDRVTVERHGNRVLDLAIKDVTVGAAVGALPSGPPANFSDVGASAVTPRTVAEGVTEIAGYGGGQYRTFAVETPEGVVVFDALLGLAVSRQVIAAVNQRLPGKAIAGVVISHFHADHASGVGAFVDAGVRVVTAPGTEDVLARYASARSALQSQPAATRRPVFVLVSDAQMPMAGGLEVHRLQTPHVRGILLLFDRRSGTVINGDLYSEVTPFNETFMALAEWVASRKGDVKRIVGTHHDEISVADFLAKAEDFKKTRQ